LGPSPHRADARGRHHAANAACDPADPPDWETHKTKAAFKRDRRKDAALTAAGHRVMRFTYEDLVYEPDTVVARLRA
jgi:G:T-mismatch repair DNA endonuclease (very short patch repair protein)